MIRLAAFDLDQTLFGNDLIISERVRQAIAQAQAEGVIITLVTGRNYQFSRHYAKELGIRAPLICSQGGVLYDPVQDRLLRQEHLPEELLPEIVAAIDHYGWSLHFDVCSQIYVLRHSYHPPIFYELTRLSEVVEVADLLHDLPELPQKFLLTLNQPEERLQVMLQMAEAFADRLSIVPSHPYLVEGVPKGIDKGRGLAWVANSYNIPAAEVMAVGDNDTDVPMLVWAGLGVAMGNASPAAQAVADWIAPPLEEDGAAVALEKFILGKVST